MSKSSNGSNDVSFLSFLAVIAVLTMAMAGIFGIFGYVDYLHDGAREQACDEAYGEGSEWIGNTFDDGAVCETPSGEVGVVDSVSSKPMSLTTFSGFLHEVAGVFN